jgi:hypothetical protein
MGIDNLSIAGIVVVAVFIFMLLAMFPRWSFDPECERSEGDCE